MTPESASNKLRRLGNIFGSSYVTLKMTPKESAVVGKDFIIQNIIETGLNSAISAVMLGQRSKIWLICRFVLYMEVQTEANKTKF